MDGDTGGAGWFEQGGGLQRMGLVAQVGNVALAPARTPLSQPEEGLGDWR